MAKEKRSATKDGQKTPHDPPAARGLEITIDEPLQRLGWRIERATWLLISVLLLLAMLGLFGGGPLSKKSVESGALSLEYESPTRQLKQTPLRALVGTPGSDALRLALSAAYVRQAQIEDIDPEPERQELAGDSVVYTFARSGASATITFYVRPQKFGALDGRIRIVDGPAVEFRQFIYP